MTSIYTFTCSKYPCGDLNLNQCGFQICEGGYSFGPRSRPYYLIHFVESGEGIFFKQNKAFKVTAGEMFVITPGEITTYTADKDNPWKYKWIAFSGNMAGKLLSQCGYNSANPIINGKSVENIFDELNDADKSCDSFYIYAAAQLFLFFSHLKYKKTAPDKDTLLSRAEKYINENLTNKITVESVSSHLYITRSFLFKLFKKHHALSPIRYIIESRLRRAAQLLEDTSLQVAYISDLLMFNNPSIFCKYFKEYYTVTPKQFRKKFE